MTAATISPPAAPPDSFFDLGAHLRAFPSGSVRWLGARRTLRDIERMVVECRLVRAERLARSLMRELPDNIQRVASWPICLAFSDRYGERRVLVLPGPASSPEVLTKLPDGLVPTGVTYGTDGQILAWVASGELVNAAEALAEENPMPPAPPPSQKYAPTEGPISTWLDVARAIGRDESTIRAHRRRTRDAIRPYFGTPAEARAWYAQLVAAPDYVPAVQKARGRRRNANPEVGPVDWTKVEV